MSDLNLRKLAKGLETASEDKADLFDFYHENWGKLINEIAKLRRRSMGNANPTAARGEVLHLCDECDEAIPDMPDGPLANSHHKASCSLYDAENL